MGESKKDILSGAYQVRSLRQAYERGERAGQFSISPARAATTRPDIARAIAAHKVMETIERIEADPQSQNGPVDLAENYKKYSKHS